MGIVLDLIVIAIIVLYVFLSAKRGFVRTAVELVGFFLAIYLSFALSDVFANLVYDKMVEPALVDNITQSVDAATLSNVSSTVDSVWDSLPKFVISAAERFGTSKSDIQQKLGQNITKNSEEIIQGVLRQVAKPIIVTIAKALIFLILLLALFFVVKLLAKIINTAFKIPVVSGINKTLGGVFGFFKGIIIATAFCIVVSVIVSLTRDGFLIFTNQNIEKSYLFRLLAGFNPLFK